MEHKTSPSHTVLSFVINWISMFRSPPTWWAWLKPACKLKFRSPAVNSRFYPGYPGKLLVLVTGLFCAGAQAQVPDEFSDVVIFATNSIFINQGTAVESGDVVVNDASPGPVIDSGVELSIRRQSTFAGTIVADSIALANGVVPVGGAECNAADSTGVTCSGLSLPVFSQPPAFQEAVLRGDDISVGLGETRTLDAGDYGSITIDKGGILQFSGGVYNIHSILPVDTTGGPCGFDPCRKIEFQAPADVRIFGRLFTGKDAFMGPSAGSGISAADIIVYVGASNADPADPNSQPAAVKAGQDTTIEANIYAAYGTIRIDKESSITGALLGRDVWIDKDIDVNNDNHFFNKPPVAFPRDASTAGADSIVIEIEGSDPEGGALTFSIDTGPVNGFLDGPPIITQLTPTSASVTYKPNVPGEDEVDNFFFQVTDPEGLVSAPAEVRINPPGDPNTPPDNPTDQVVANDQLCDSLDPVDCSLETIEDTSVTLVLTGAAPCEEVNPPEAQPCDGNGNDVPLTFSLPSLATSQGGTLSDLNQGTGELQEPPGPDEVPQRTASVLYTPPAGFTGVDSFTFDVTGDVDGSGGIDPSPEPNPEVASATVEISVQTFTPPPPVEARDQNVSTEMNTPVDINLSGGRGPCDPVTDPDCRQTTQAQSGQPKSLQNAKPQRSSPIRKVADDTGSLNREKWRLQKAGRDYGTSKPQKSKPGPTIAAALPGERLFAIDSDLDQLFELSPVDATSTLVGSTAAGPSTPASLAFDGVNMFTIDLGGGGLYKLNLNNGAPTLVCSTGISGWQGVASDPTDEGQFYGITQSDDLYKIDRTNCTTTRVNATAGTVGGLIAALEFDANGTLWGAEFGSPGSTTENAALVTIDKTTGAVTVVSQCATRPCSGSDNFADGFQGIDFSTDGTLYGQNTNDDSLYIIDTTDGSLTFLGSNGTIFVKGLAFSEEVLLQPGFKILTLPAVGTLSYIDPLTGVLTEITAGDLPLLLPTEQVTYTPPTGATGEPLTSFTFEQSDGLTSDTGTIDLFVFGGVIIIDPCSAVGRPPGCIP